MNKHDSHYSKMEIEPITVIEQRMCTAIGTVSPKENMNIAAAIKYAMRAGTKEKQDWRKDIEKAINHLGRALSGQWVTIGKESKDVPKS